MKKHSRKLNLNRETLIPLQADDLNQINGGLTPTTGTGGGTATTSTCFCTTGGTISIPTRTVSWGGQQ